MKICILSAATPAHRRGGTETHCWNLATRAAALGHKVTLLTTKLEGKPLVETSNGFSVHYLENTNAAMSRRWVANWRKASAGRIREIHSADPQDVIWAEGFSGLGHTDSSRAATGLPMITTLHGFGFRGDVASELAEVSSLAGLARFLTLRQAQFFLSYLPWYRRIMSFSDSVVSVSRESAEELKREFPGAAGKVATIYNGIDTGLFRPSPEARKRSRAELGILPDEKLVLMTGAATRQKGFHIGMKAFSIILGARKLKLAIAGEGPELPFLKKYAGKLGISRNTLFTGSLPNDAMPPLYNAADVYLNPTLRAEGFGVVTAEAMACGKPCVVSLSGGTGSTVIEGESGFFVKPGDAEGTASKLLELLDDAPLMSRFAAAARARAVENFDLGTMTGAYISLSNTILNGGGKK